MAPQQVGTPQVWAPWGLLGGGRGAQGPDLRPQQADARPSAQPQQRRSLRGCRGQGSAGSATRPPAGRRAWAGERRQQCPVGTLRAPTTACGALTGLPSRYTRKSVSLTPEKRRPCGAEDRVGAGLSPSQGRKTGQLSQTGSLGRRLEVAAFSVSSLGWLGPAEHKQSPSPATLHQVRPAPQSPRRPQPARLHGLLLGSVPGEELLLWALPES